MLNKKSRRQNDAQCRTQAGVTILEMCISMLVLTVGLLAVAAAIGYAVTVSNKGRNVSNTKLLVVSMLEQIETLRNTKQLTFGQIANQGQVDNTGASREFLGFPAGFLPVSANPGPDGIFNTNDDLTSAGADGIYGNGDDFTDNSLRVQGYVRQVLITTLNPNLKRIEVNLKYPDSGGQMRTIQGVSYLNNDTRSNFR